jgi:hypothetical protein
MVTRCDGLTELQRLEATELDGWFLFENRTLAQQNKARAAITNAAPACIEKSVSYLTQHRVAQNGDQAGLVAAATRL